MIAGGRVRVAGRPEQFVVRRQPLFRVPPWLVLVGLVLRGLWRLALFAAKHPVASTVLLAAAWLWITYDGRTLAVTLGFLILGVVLVVGGWWLWKPAQVERWMFLPLLGQWRRRWTYGRRWDSAMRMCGLAMKLDHAVLVPTLRKVVCTPATDRLVVRMLLGQNPEDFRAAVLNLAYSFGARSAQVFEQRPDSRPQRTGRLAWLWRRVDDWRWADRPADVHVVIVRRDCLHRIVEPLPFASCDRAVDLAALPIARSFLGEMFRFRLLATHLLIVGASRRGKGSVVWSLIASVAPAVKSGLVRLMVIDPKGGMELAMGRAMFHRFAYRTWEDMADLLDEAVAVMRERQARLHGVVRAHTPTVDDPLVLVVVDELGALTRYLPDVELRKRMEAALGLLLSQGAGMGVLVVGALQDPRKENLDLRDLFLSRVLLGVQADTHVDMVLGDGMRKRGALADLLPESAKGVGYVLPDGCADPVKVRFPFLDDDAIRAMAATYPAPAPTGPLPGAVPAQSNGHTARGPLLPASLLAAIRNTTGEEK